MWIVLKRRRESQRDHLSKSQSRDREGGKARPGQGIYFFLFYSDQTMTVYLSQNNDRTAYISISLLLVLISSTCLHHSTFFVPFVCK